MPEPGIKGQEPLQGGARPHVFAQRHNAVVCYRGRKLYRGDDVGNQAHEHTRAHTIKIPSPRSHRTFLREEKNARHGDRPSPFLPANAPVVSVPVSRGVWMFSVHAMTRDKKAADDYGQIKDRITRGIKQAKDVVWAAVHRVCYPARAAGDEGGLRKLALVWEVKQSRAKKQKVILDEGKTKCRCNVVLGNYEPDSTMVSVAVNGGLYRLEAGENRIAGSEIGGVPVRNGRWRSHFSYSLYAALELAVLRTPTITIGMQDCTHIS
ncbi:uncharacterized protein BT62DRAFT_1078892 [Guyanagaster necrorhizus]|uniref:Uncharacterized protein n=1 Tax=Guyanagaster necrorhizus TaxID=856835 RepID=A0A9P7VMD6_9AGAR|nr:uncharacterized protein BT62DRAFT_1078892 [Guyanagaster necrorhizus MCA 3950]KAG7443170.1 hypothetical protein BT62DRAFT_1078892 [Guyanagaster necrorhizus MCA 3950]